MTTRFLVLVLSPLIGACTMMPLGPSFSGSSSSSGTSFRVPTLQPPPPTLTAISPSSVAPGTAITVVFTGTNFRQFDTRVTIDGKGIMTTAFSVTSATEMTALVTVEPKTPAGEHQVRLATSGGTTEPQTFAVVASLQSSVASR